MRSSVHVAFSAALLAGALGCASLPGSGVGERESALARRQASSSPLPADLEVAALVSAREQEDRIARFGTGDRAVAEGYRLLGEIAEARGLPIEALDHYESAVRSWELAAGRDTLEVATARCDLARLLAQTADFASAESEYAEAFAVFERLARPGDPVVAGYRVDWGRLYFDSERPLEARAHAEQALEVFEESFGEDDPRTSFPLLLLGNTFLATDELDEAEPLMRRALAIRESQLGRDHPHVAGALLSLGSTTLLRGRLHEAEPLLQRALAISERSSTGWTETPKILMTLGRLRVLQNRSDEAKLLYRRSIESFESRYGRRHPEIAAAVSSLGEVYFREGRLSDAKPLFERALRVRERAFGPDSTALDFDLEHLVRIAYLEGRESGARERYAESRAHARRALAIRELELGPDAISTGGALAWVGITSSLLGDHAEALPALERAIRIFDREHLRHTPEWAEAALALGREYGHAGRPADAEPLLRALLAQGKGDPHALPGVDAALEAELASIYGQLGQPELAREYATRAARDPRFRSYVSWARGRDIVGSIGAAARAGRFDEADRIGRAGLEEQRVALGPDSPALLTTLLALAEVAKSRGRPDDWRRWVTESERILATAKDVDPSTEAHVRAAVAAARLHSGKQEAAAAELERAAAAARRVPASAEWASSLRLDIAVELRKLGRADRAEAIVADVVATEERAKREHPVVLARALNNLAYTRSQQRRFSESRPVYERALEVRRSLGGPPDELLGLILCGLAWVLQNQGEWDASVPLAKEALTAYETGLGAQHVKVADAAELLGNAHAYRREFRQAEPLLGRALAIREHALTPGDEAIARVRDLHRTVAGEAARQH